MSDLAEWMTRPTYNEDRTRVTWSPPLPSFKSDGSRGFARLAAVHRAHELADLGNPYAAGLVDVPDVVGGYALAAVTDDGATLCETCAVDPANPVHPAIPGDRYPDGWGVAAWITSGDLDGPEWCDHCGREWTGHEEGDR